MKRYVYSAARILLADVTASACRLQCSAQLALSCCRKFRRSRPY